MNIFFRSLLSSSSRSSYIHYFTFISDNAEEKKNIKAEKDRQSMSCRQLKKKLKKIHLFLMTK